MKLNIYMSEQAREYIPNQPEAPKTKPDADQSVTYDQAEVAAKQEALAAAGAQERNESITMAQQLSQELHKAPHIEAVPKSSVLAASEGQQRYAMARAEQDISREWQALSEEVGLDVASLKQVEARYDKIDAGTKEALGLPEHFDQIVTTKGKKIGKGWFGHIVKEFTGRGGRYDLFSKAQDLVASQNPEKRQWEK